MGTIAEQTLHIRAYGEPGLDDSTPAYILTLHDRTVYTLARDGAVLARTDGPNGWNYAHRWHITGFGTRPNSGHLVSVEDAANGADIGQGWVHDLDHGTHRMWASPSTQRAASVRPVR
jgi:hypothetical protein